jgi:hypothetical protein
LPAAPPCLSFPSPTVCRSRTSFAERGLKTREEKKTRGEPGDLCEEEEVRKRKVHWAGEGFIGPDLPSVYGLDYHITLYGPIF